MKATFRNRTEIIPKDLVERGYKKHEMVGGLISWKEVVYENKIGTDLFISTTEDFDNIYLNGKKLKWKE